jgi:hypothetical protein
LNHSYSCHRLVGKRKVQFRYFASAARLSIQLLRLNWKKMGHFLNVMTSLKKTMTILELFWCTSATVCCVLSFYLLHVCPRHEYSFLLRLFVGYCLRYLFFPHPHPHTLANLSPLMGLTIVLSHTLLVILVTIVAIINHSRPVARSSSIFGIFCHNHNSGYA